MKKMIALFLSVCCAAGSLFATEVKGPLKIDLPVRPGYAEQIKGADGVRIFKMTGRPERGKRNAWASAIVPLSYKEPAGKVFRLKADVKMDKLGKGSFWLVFREVNSQGKTVTYDGFFLKKDCDWTAVSKDVTIRKNATRLQLFGVGINMPEGSTAQVKNLTVEEVK